MNFPHLEMKLSRRDLSSLREAKESVEGFGHFICPFLS